MMSTPGATGDSVFCHINRRSLGHKSSSDAGLAYGNLVARRLAHSGQGVGHDGCVNRLHWTDDGRLIASVSDDLTIRLWTPDIANGTINVRQVIQTVRSIHNAPFPNFT